MMIIDGHVHVFPYLGGACGWESASKHLVALQTAIYSAARPNANETKRVGRPPNIRFRVGEFGRFEWTEDGIDYYHQYMPPNLQNQTASPEFILAQMDHAGIKIAVLQNTKLYGKLNEYLAKCIKMYPDRFVGLAEIDELEADNEKEIIKLRHAIKDQGLRGIYYEATRFLNTGNTASFNDKRFDLFWQEVGDLGIPVHWQLVSSRMPKKVFMEQIKVFSLWIKKYPHITSVMVHGLFARPFKENDGFRFPKELINLFKKSNVLVEILYPIQAGPLGWDYPFPQAQRLIKEQYEELGPHKLIWGSDMPNVERNCTYKQALTYLQNYCDFITTGDMELILGGNIKRIMKIDTGLDGNPRPILASIA